MFSNVLHLERVCYNFFIGNRYTKREGEIVEEYAGEKTSPKLWNCIFNAFTNRGVHCVICG